MAAAMRVRVVGSSASVPRPGRACSCHLIRARGTNLLLDMGTGALANLRIVMDYPDLDGILITHMHADHFLDLIPLRYGLKYGPLLRDDRMPMYGCRRAASSNCAPLPQRSHAEGPSDFLDEVFEVREYDPAGQLEIGRFRSRSRRRFTTSMPMRSASNGTVRACAIRATPRRAKRRGARARMQHFPVRGGAWACGGNGSDARASFSHGSGRDGATRRRASPGAYALRYGICSR